MIRAAKIICCFFYPAFFFYFNSHGWIGKFSQYVICNVSFWEYLKIAFTNFSFFFYQWPLMSPTITADKRPQSDHRKTPDCSSFSPFCLPLSMIFEQRPWSPADSAQQQIDISGIDIYCSGPRNHFHFTLCCTGKIRHLRYPANQMSFNRTLSLTFTTVYPTNFS